MLRHIMEGNYEFVSPEWDDISDSAKDLVSCEIIAVEHLIKETINLSTKD